MHHWTAKVHVQGPIIHSPLLYVQQLLDPFTWASTIHGTGVVFVLCIRQYFCIAWVVVVKSTTATSVAGSCLLFCLGLLCRYDSKGQNVQQTNLVLPQMEQAKCFGG